MSTSNFTNRLKAAEEQANALLRALQIASDPNAKFQLSSDPQGNMESLLLFARQIHIEKDPTRRFHLLFKMRVTMALVFKRLGKSRSTWRASPDQGLVFEFGGVYRRFASMFRDLHRWIRQNCKTPDGKLGPVKVKQACTELPMVFEVWDGIRLIWTMRTEVWTVGRVKGN